MKYSVRRCMETFLRTQAFGRENIAAEPTSFVGRHLAAIDSVLTGLEAYACAQAASHSALRQGALGRAAAHAKLMSALEAIGRTARPMAANDPTLQQQFRVPQSRSNQAVLTTAAAFAVGARQLRAEFVLRGLPESFVEELEADADALRAAIARNIESRRARLTATAVIHELIERGLKALRELNPYMRNIYAADPAKLAAWRSASRVSRRSAPAREEGQPAAPPDAPAPAPAA